MTSQNPTQNALVVAGIAIRQDSEGRYCLNDLHKAAVASGANERTKEPGKFLASPQIIELVGELQTTQNLGSLPINKIEGRNGGTFACRELVYAYAMWISPAFHLKVIRAYDAMMTQPQPTFDPRRILEDPAAMRGLLLNYTEKVLALEEIVRIQKPKVEFHDAVAGAVNCQTIQEVAKVLGTGQNRLFKYLRNELILMNSNLPYQQYIDAGYFRVTERKYKDEAGDNHIYTKTLVTGKGLQFIQRRLQGFQMEMDLGQNDND